ncbi:MAG: hypothetical protein ACI8QZ_000694 [Chlamydiales bacterium]|jgi:hypothetical protein
MDNARPSSQPVSAPAKGHLALPSAHRPEPVMTTTSAPSSPSTLQYLDKALAGLRSLGFGEQESQPAPVVALLNQISDLDEDRIIAIARTLDEASHFNQIVREEIQGVSIGQRYEDITTAFNSIRDDAKAMVDHYEDGKIDTLERLSTIWMKVTRGDIASRFEKISDTFLEVAASSKDQIEREHRILEAYHDFRGALKQSEVQALEILKKAQGHVASAKQSVVDAGAMVTAYAGDEPAERAKLELVRDEAVRMLQNEDRRYQIAKDLSDNLTVGYNTSEVIMARLTQTTNAKERVYAQAVSFFGTNETVLTALSASFTGMHGLHESTQALEAMKKGVADSLETLADIGGKVQEAALQAGYGPSIQADSVKRLVDSVVSYQQRSRAIIEEMRDMATRNADEIRDAVEDGKRRMAHMLESSAIAATS